mmetsp:Transcript_146363/g.469570  ORF Transcript_146363/g.469570 Transcript_146363/m.469570 type:complete len:328 (-) Transcript_146363:551-1534(-)
MVSLLPLLQLDHLSLLFLRTLLPLEIQLVSLLLEVLVGILNACRQFLIRQLQTFQFALLLCEMLEDGVWAHRQKLQAGQDHCSAHLTSLLHDLPRQPPEAPSPQHRRRLSFAELPEPLFVPVALGPDALAVLLVQLLELLGGAPLLLGDAAHPRYLVGGRQGLGGGAAAAAAPEERDEEVVLHAPAAPPAVAPEEGDEGDVKGHASADALSNAGGHLEIAGVAEEMPGQGHRQIDDGEKKQSEAHLAHAKGSVSQALQLKLRVQSRLETATRVGQVLRRPRQQKVEHANRQQAAGAERLAARHTWRLHTRSAWPGRLEEHMLSLGDD